MDEVLRDAIKAAVARKGYSVRGFGLCEKVFAGEGLVPDWYFILRYEATNPSNPVEFNKKVVVEVLNIQRINDKQTGILPKINGPFMNAPDMVDVVITAQIIPSPNNDSDRIGVKFAVMDLRTAPDNTKLFDLTKVFGFTCPVYAKDPPRFIRICKVEWPKK